MVSRREFLLAAAAAPAAGLAGSVLVHEHVLVDFAGAEKASPDRYDREEVIRTARPKLEEVKAMGCRRLLECTPNGLGRDPALLGRLEELTGVELWTNTGLYGAANRSGVPKYAWEESAGQLAKRWTAEARNGVAGRRPRFIKTGVNGFPLEAIDVKLVEAAALTSLETGLTVASHTNGAGRAAEAQMEIFTRMRAPLSKFVWVHAQSEKDHGFHRRAAEAGAWVEFDGISEKSLEWHVECVRSLAEGKLLGRTLASQDAGWYHVGEPGGGAYRGYTLIYTDFLPRLGGAEGQQLLVENPVAAFGR